MIGKTFCDYLKGASVSAELFSILCSLKDVAKEISVALRTSDVSKAGSKNVYGEDQLSFDIASDELIQKALKNNPNVGLLASEELPDEIKISDAPYAVCYDPLDGSSLLDVNLAVGSIFGVYKTSTFLGCKGNEMVASMYALYGSKTTIVLTVGQGTHEFTLRPDDRFFLTKENIKIVNDKKMFAPGNLRACKFRADYLELMNYWMKEQYKLRYSGGMVPDINQILLKGRGIFAYPSYEEAPEGKLRLLFECAPMAMLVEQAFGQATDSKGGRILDICVSKLSQRVPILIGAKEEVAVAENFLNP